MPRAGPNHEVQGKRADTTRSCPETDSFGMDKAKQVVKADKETDLKGEVCPHTFVKSKLALEEMMPGQALRVVVDHVSATRNVPRSTENEGNEVLDASRLNDLDWQIVIRKVE